MKKTLLALMLMAGSTFAQDPYSVGPGVGGPGNYPPPGAYPASGQDPYPMGPNGGAPGQNPYSVGYPPAGAYGPPAACGPGYVWIDGYTDANGYVVNGYCAVPPFTGAYWIAPGFFGGRFVAGYWGHGGAGYGPGFGVRSVYGGAYAVRGGFSGGSRFAGGGYANGGYVNSSRAPVAAAGSFQSQRGTSSFRAPVANARSIQPQSGNRGGGSAPRGGGAGHGERR